MVKNVWFQVIDSSDSPTPDMLCLAGRIYKDKFTESGYTDQNSLKEAIKW